MSFFYECTIPFNGIQQTIRVLHLRAAQSLLENQQHWPRDSHWVLSLAEGRVSSILCCTQIPTSEVASKKLSQISHHFHHVFSLKNASQTQQIFWLSKEGFYHQGLFWVFLFLTTDHTYPKTGLTEELEGVELNKMGLIFRNGISTTCPFLTLKSGAESIYKSFRSF